MVQTAEDRSTPNNLACRLAPVRFSDDEAYVFPGFPSDVGRKLDRNSTYERIQASEIES